MFALPTLGGRGVSIASPSSPSSLKEESVIDVQIVPSHKKTFPLFSSVLPKERVEIPYVPAPRLSPLAKNVVLSQPKKVRSPRMKRIKREDYIAALKSLPPLPKVQEELQGLSLSLPQIPQVPVMLPNITSTSFEDMPYDPEEEEEVETSGDVSLSLSPERFNWGSEPEDEDEEDY